MKKLLPQTKSNPSGFTLIELMVVIGIIAIVSVIAFALFGNAQKQARDGKRKAELEQIANVLEVNKGTNYGPILAAQFAGSTFPGPAGTAQADDPSNMAYCVAASSATNLPADVSTWAVSTCPAGFTVISGTQPAGTVTSYKICTLVEVASSGNVTPTTLPTGFVGAYCRTSLQ